jgi:hypothetical protein
MAVVRGLEYALKTDGNVSLIRIVSDCEYVLHWIAQANGRAEGRAGGKRVPDCDADLIWRLYEIARLRSNAMTSIT